MQPKRGKRIESSAPSWHGNVLAAPRKKLDSGEATLISVNDLKEGRQQQNAKRPSWKIPCLCLAAKGASLSTIILQERRQS
jgi:hypothetical protein